MRRSVSNGTRSLSADVVYEPVCFIQHVRFVDHKEDPDAEEPHVPRCCCCPLQASISCPFPALCWVCDALHVGRHSAG